MHVGHLRSTIIGDALARLLEFAGHDVIRQNHIGDWGTPFGMLIEHLLDVGEGGVQDDMGELSDFYRAARAKFDSDPGFADRARQRVVLLQAGDARTLELWRQFVDLSNRYFSTVTSGSTSGCSMSTCEARARTTALADVAAELERKGLARINDGALCAFPPGFTNRDGEPLPLIVRKQDGGYGYGATDLATLRYRTQTLGGTRLLYVVGTPQAQHLSMVFAVGMLASWLTPPARAEHVAFGSVLGADKKMLKARGGDTVRLTDLLDEAVERAAAELNAAARRRRGARPRWRRDRHRRRQVRGSLERPDQGLRVRLGPDARGRRPHGTVSAIRARAHPLDLPPCGGAGCRAQANAAISLREPAERKLALELLDFGDAVIEAGETLRPHRLCGYLYDLATAFTAFFETCPVLKAPDDATRASRLALCELTARALSCGLGLLGIAAPERM